jgi:hypothetical protein
MKCVCCGETKDVKMRANPLEPFFFQPLAMCSNCFHKQRIPYKDMIDIMSLYDRTEDIPVKVRYVISNTLNYYHVNFFKLIDDLMEIRVKEFADFEKMEKNN